MTPVELQQYKHVQSIAKDTIEFLKSFIKEGLSAHEIIEASGKFMYEKGVVSFWYYNLVAYVLVGSETTNSISGKEYQPSSTKVKTNDLVTVDLSPAISNYWGDFARSFIVENGKVIDAANSRNQELVEGVKAEQELHRQFQNLISEDMSFAEAYSEMNTLIEGLGFENLDFKQNLGHSIAKQRDQQIWLAVGNKTKLKDVDLFTFEPHIKKIGHRYGFKQEDIYYFSEGKIQILYLQKNQPSRLVFCLYFTFPVTHQTVFGSWSSRRWFLQGSFF